MWPPGLPSSCPPPALVKEVLSNVQRLTFYGFLVALSKHHGINQALGKLWRHASPAPPTPLQLWKGTSVSRGGAATKASSPFLM